MEGIIIYNGKGDVGYVKVWLKYEKHEAYLQDHDLVMWDNPYDTTVFDVGGPKCLIKW